MKFKAFTLLEVLIIIVVFGVGVLSVLHGVSQTLNHKEFAKAQITSSFLAREGIELAFNLRESNAQKELPRNCIFQTLSPDIPLQEDHICADFITGGTVLKVGFSSGADYFTLSTGILSDEFSQNLSTFQLSYLTGTTLDQAPFLYGPYDTDDIGTTQYARYLLFTPVKEGDAILPVDHILKIESHVLYQNSLGTGEQILESFFGNY